MFSESMPVLFGLYRSNMERAWFAMMGRFIRIDNIDGRAMNYPKSYPTSGR